MNDGNANRIQGIRTLWLRQRVLLKEKQYCPEEGQYCAIYSARAGAYYEAHYVVVCRISRVYRRPGAHSLASQAQRAPDP